MLDTDRQPQTRELAIRIASLDALFNEFDAAPIVERGIAEDARLYLLDQWDNVRKARPTALIIHAPATERASIDVEAVSLALRDGLRAYARPYREAVPLSHRARVGAWVGLITFLITIAISTTLDRLTDDVLIAGVSQGIVVVGWVALWAPVQHIVVDAIPHRLARKRCAELAEMPVRFVWDP